VETSQILNGLNYKVHVKRVSVADLSCPNAILNTVFNVAVIVAFDDEIACRASGTRWGGCALAARSGRLKLGHGDARDSSAPRHPVAGTPAGGPADLLLLGPLTGGQAIFAGVLQHGVTLTLTVRCSVHILDILHLIFLFEGVEAVLLQEVSNTLGGL
jgi:hypothetical protein